MRGTWQALIDTVPYPFHRNKLTELLDELETTRLKASFAIGDRLSDPVLLAQRVDIRQDGDDGHVVCAFVIGQQTLTIVLPYLPSEVHLSTVERDSWPLRVPTKEL